MNIPTIIICAVLAAIGVYAVRSYVKKLKNGCCGGGCGELKIKPSDTNISHYPYKTTIYIEGMTCDGCKTRVENAFNGMADTYAKVNLKAKCADVYTKNYPNKNEMKDAVERLGYDCTKIL